MGKPLHYSIKGEVYVYQTVKLSKLKAFADYSLDACLVTELGFERPDNILELKHCPASMCRALVTLTCRHDLHLSGCNFQMAHDFYS